MAATIRDIAAAANVAVGTASRALSGSGSVAPQTKERVLAAAKQLKYIPNAQARSLRSDRTGAVGLLVPDARNPFFAELSYWVERTMRENGTCVLMCSANENPALMREYVHVLRTQRVDGVIVAPFLSAGPDLGELTDAGIPLVFVDRTIPDLGVPSVTSDTAQAITTVVANMLERGHATVGYISGPMDTSTGQERLHEFLQAAEHHGIAPRVVEGAFEKEAGLRGMQTLLTEGLGAVIAGDSLMTEGALAACVDAGIDPSTDLDLVGFDETPASAFLRPGIPLIVQDIALMATTSAHLLLQAISGGEPGQSARIAAEFRLPSGLRS